MRSINPDQEEYSGLVCVGNEGIVLKFLFLFSGFKTFIFNKLIQVSVNIYYVHTNKHIFSHC